MKKMIVTRKRLKAKKYESSGVNLARVQQQLELNGRRDKDPKPPPDYDIIEKNGKVIDIRLKFGHWNGFRITEMLDDHEGKRYVTSYLLNSEFSFPSDMVAIIENILEDYGDE